MKWFTIGLIILASNSLYALELDGSAQRAVDKFSEELAEAVAEFEEAKQEAYERLERSLSRERSSAARKGEQGVVDLIDETLAQAQQQMGTAGQLTDFVGAPVAVESVNARQAEQIARSLDKLTPEQWESAPGIEVVVNSQEITDSGITVKPGESYLIIPHPTETWRTWTDPTLPQDAQVDHNGFSIEQRWNGLNAAGQHPRDWGRGLMAYRIGSAETNPLHLTTVVASPIAQSQVDSEQPLWIMTRHVDRHDDVGTIRVKILRVE